MTSVEIRDDQFYIDGEVTYKAVSGEGIRSNFDLTNEMTELSPRLVGEKARLS